MLSFWRVWTDPDIVIRIESRNPFCSWLVRVRFAYGNGGLVSLCFQESWVVSKPDRGFILVRRPNYNELEFFHNCFDSRHGGGFDLAVSSGRHGTFWCEDLIL